MVAATGLGSGYAPLAPGTAGTIVAIPLYLMFSLFSWPLYLLSSLAFTCLACIMAGEAERIYREKDPPRVVIDEIAGFLWTMFLVTPTAAHVIGGFILFRVFDIVKPFPARTVQDRLPGGYGIVGDDLVAGIYGNAALAVLIKFFGV
jgi:phosphatidylglycerophosphatase A